MKPIKITLFIAALAAITTVLALTVPASHSQPVMIKAVTPTTVATHSTTIGSAPASTQHKQPLTTTTLAKTEAEPTADHRSKPTTTSTMPIEPAHLDKLIPAAGDPGFTYCDPTAGECNESPTTATDHDYAVPEDDSIGQVPNNLGGSK